MVHKGFEAEAKGRLIQIMMRTTRKGRQMPLGAQARLNGKDRRKWHQLESRRAQTKHHTGTVRTRQVITKTQSTIPKASPQSHPKPQLATTNMEPEEMPCKEGSIVYEGSVSVLRSVSCQLGPLFFHLCEASRHCDGQKAVAAPREGVGDALLPENHDLKKFKGSLGRQIGTASEQHLASPTEQRSSVSEAICDREKRARRSCLHLHRPAHLV